MSQVKAGQWEWETTVSLVKDGSSRILVDTGLPSDTNIILQGTPSLPAIHADDRRRDRQLRESEAAACFCTRQEPVCLPIPAGQGCQMLVRSTGRETNVRRY